MSSDDDDYLVSVARVLNKPVSYVKRIRDKAERQLGSVVEEELLGPGESLPDGLEIDVAGRRILLFGQPLPVGFAMNRHRQREAIWFSVLCGENQWWIEVGVYPSEGSMDIMRADWVYGDPEWHTAKDLLWLWKTEGQRTDPAPHVLDPDDSGPFAGLEPGTWLWFD